MMHNKSIQKIRLLSILFTLSFLLLSACQQLQPSTSTSPEIQPETTDTTIPKNTETSSVEKTEVATITPTPSTIPAVISKAGTPLPPNLEVITIENIEKIQHLATWGIGSPNSIQLSIDGQVLAVGTSIGVFFYDSKGLYEIAFRETPHGVISTSFSPDNEFFAVSQVGGTIDIYDRSDFSFIDRLYLPELSLHDDYSLDCFFFQDVSKLISVIRTDQSIIIDQWSYDDWKHIAAFSIDNGLTSFINSDISAVGVITKESLVFQSMLYSEETRRIELPTSLPTSFWENLVENKGNITPTANGEGLLINNGSSISYWEIFSGQNPYQLTDYPSTIPDPCQDIAETCLNDNGEISWVCQETTLPPVGKIAVTPDNIMVLVLRNDEKVELRRVQDGLLVWVFDGLFTEICFSPGSEFYFGLREDGVIEKRSTERGTLLGSIDQYPGKLYDIAFSPNGEEIAAGINNGWIQMMDAKSGQSLGVLEGSAITLEFSPVGGLLAAGLQDGTVRVFTLENGRYFDLSGHLDSVTDLAFSENGRNLLSGSDDCTISLWDVENELLTQTIIPGKETPFSVKRVAFSPVDEEQYLVGGRNSLLIASDQIKLSLLPSILLSDFSLSQNEQTLAVSGASTWVFREINEQAYTNNMKLTTLGHTVSLNNTGSLLGIGTSDSIEFWSVNKAIKLHTIYLNNPAYNGNYPVKLAFSPDNTLIALGYQNGLIEIYGIPIN